MRFAPDSNLPDMSRDDYREYIAGEGLPSEDVIAARVDAFREREKDMPMKPFFIGEATLDKVRYIVHGYYRKEADGAEYIDSPIIEYEREGGERVNISDLAKCVKSCEQFITTNLEREIIMWALTNGKGVIR